MKNYPKLFYEQEQKPIHKIGYTLALAIIGVGLLETAHSIPYIIKGESDLTGITLGPIAIVGGGVIAYSYLKEAGVVY
jgi:hypothetical protein